MSNLLLSIVIPAYNEGEKIYTLFDYLKKQDREDIEIIIVDDGSTDNTYEIIKSYKNQFANFKCYTKKNEGPGKTRNYGLSKATGEFIYFHDADDSVTQNAISIILQTLKNQPELEMLIFGYIKESVSNDKLQDEYISNLKPSYFPTHQKLIENFGAIQNMGGRFSVWNKVFKRSVIQGYRISYPNRRRTQDMHFFIDYFAVVNNCKIIKEVLYKHRSVYNASKHDNALFINHFDLYQKLQKLLNQSLNAENERYLLKVFLLWFSYIIPKTIFQNENISKKEKKQILDEMFTNEKFISEINSLKKTKGITRKNRFLLTVLSQKSSALMFILVKITSLFSKDQIKKMTGYFQTTN